MARYQIIRKLATSGMVEVFLGRALGAGGLARPVAIKRILPHLAADRDFVNRFLDEARLTVHLQHANVVQVFDLGHSGADHVMVLELVDGETLRALMQKAHAQAVPLPHHLMAFVIQQVAEGLAYAHEVRVSGGTHLHIIHRDINPGNVMVSVAGEVKLADFGLARAALPQSQTATGPLRGKVGYLAPEVAKGHHADQHSDVFLMGLLLFEVLAGRRLFAQADFAKSLAEVRDFDLRQVLCPVGVPPRLWEITAQALHPDPERRTKSARELSMGLSSYLFDNRLRVGPNDIAQLFARVFPQRQTTLHDLDARPLEELELSVDVRDAPRPPDKGMAPAVGPSALEAARPKVKVRLGEMLLQQQRLTQAQLDQALSAQKRGGGQLGEVLLSMGMVTDDDLHGALAEQKGQRFMKSALLEQVEVPPALRALVPPAVAARLQVLPLSIDEKKHLQVALADPGNLKVLDELRALTGAVRVNPVVARPRALEKRLERYGPDGDLAEAPTSHRPTTPSLSASSRDTLLFGAASAEDPATLHVLRLQGLMHVAAARLRLADSDASDLEQQAAALFLAGVLERRAPYELPSRATLLELMPQSADAAALVAGSKPASRRQELLAGVFHIGARLGDLDAPSSGALSDLKRSGRVSTEVYDAIALGLQQHRLKVAVIAAAGSAVFCAVPKLLRAGHRVSASTRDCLDRAKFDAAIIDATLEDPKAADLVKRAAAAKVRVIAVSADERRTQPLGSVKPIGLNQLDAAIAALLKA